MKQKYFWSGIILVGMVTVLVGIKQPFYLAFGPTNGEWQVLRWINILFPVVVSIFLTAILLSGRERQRIKLASYAISGTFFLFVFLIGYVAFSLYLSFRNNELGRYFLPPYSYYYLNLVWRFTLPLVSAVLTSGGLTLLFLLLSRLREGRLVGEIEVKSGALIGLVLGFERTVIALVLAVSVAVLFSLIINLKGSSRPVRLLIPLFIGAWIAMFWGSEIANMLFGI